MIIGNWIISLKNLFSMIGLHVSLYFHILTIKGDTCGQYPICGVRFSCVTCEDFDLCEACFDTIILSKKGNHDETHIFDAKEIPDHGAGFPIHHRIRCNGCYICPIIGERFHCLECQDVNLCRKCFFNKKEPKQHKHTHEIEFIPESLTSHKHFKW